jgi:hypothetical protein
VTIIGSYTTHIFYENGKFRLVLLTFIDRYLYLESGPKGFYAKFPAGPMQNISNTTYCTPSLKIKFECNLDAKWLAPLGNLTGMAPEPTYLDVDDADPCAVIIFK